MRKFPLPIKKGTGSTSAKTMDCKTKVSFTAKNLKMRQPEVFLNPNEFSEDGTTSLAGMNFSEDGKTLAYSISEGGSDWRKIIVIDAETREVKEDTIIDVKFSGISWKGNEGFYYSSYDKPKGSELSAKTDQHKLYYHKLGTPQSEDKLIFGGTPEQKHRYVAGSVSEDNRYLFISARQFNFRGKIVHDGPYQRKSYVGYYSWP